MRAVVVVGVDFFFGCLFFRGVGFHYSSDFPFYISVNVSLCKWSKLYLEAE